MPADTEIFTTIDLEMSQPEGNIIMLGACVGNIRTGEVLDSLRCYVSVQESISPYITGLTGITNQDLKTKGITLEEAYDQLVSMHSKHSSHPCLVQWGSGDEHKLRGDLLAVCCMQPSKWIFGRRSFDVKTVYQTICIANGLKFQGGLAKSMTKVGLNFQGRKHDAMDDAINTFRMFCKLLTKIKESSSVERN